VKAKPHKREETEDMDKIDYPTNTNLKATSASIANQRTESYFTFSIQTNQNPERILLSTL